jgi:hypothetical protein
MRLLSFATSLYVVFASCLFAQESPTPTKHHESMKQEVGTWSTSMKLLVGPEMPAMEGTEVNELMPGGLWLMSKFDSGPFKGHGVFGYDTKKKKHVGIWVDNSTTQMTMFEGDADKDGVMTLFGKSANPETGKVEKVKSVTRMIGKDAKKFEMYAQGEDGKWTKTFVIDYKRKK